MVEDWKVIWSPASEEELSKWKSLLDCQNPVLDESQLSLEQIMCRAIRGKDYTLVRDCISHGAKLNDWVYGAVSQAMSLELLQVLVPAGLDVNHKEDRLGGYIAATASCNQMDLTRYLLQHGADPNRNPLLDLNPALNMAVKGNFMEMAELLIQHGAKVNGLGALAMAAKHGRFEMMKLLFEYGADVNDDAKDRAEECIDYIEGVTALHEAAKVGRMDSVVFLLNHGANPDLKDEDGQTPLTVAQVNGHSEVVEFLNKLQQQDG